MDANTPAGNCTRPNHRAPNCFGSRSCFCGAVFRSQEIVRVNDSFMRGCVDRRRSFPIEERGRGGTSLGNETTIKCAGPTKMWIAPGIEKVGAGVRSGRSVQLLDAVPFEGNRRYAATPSVLALADAIRRSRRRLMTGTGLRNRSEPIGNGEHSH